MPRRNYATKTRRELASLKEENDRLRAENKRLREENKGLRDVSHLNDDLRQLKKRRRTSMIPKDTDVDEIMSPFADKMMSPLAAPMFEEVKVEITLGRSKLEPFKHLEDLNNLFQEHWFSKAKGDAMLEAEDVVSYFN